MKKILIISGVVLAVFVAGYVGAINVGLADNPMKVIDPSDPRFDPLKFDYCDYDEDAGELLNVFRILFPPNTSKEFIDRVLIKEGKGAAGRYNEAIYENQIVYKMRTYTPPNNLCNWHLKQPSHYIFIFDLKDNLINIETQRGAKIFPDHLGRNELKATYQSKHGVDNGE